MALLESRDIPEAFESLEGLQLGRGITYAEEQLRSVIRRVFGGCAVFEQREIITPKKKCRPEILHDPSGVVMRGDLLDDIACRRWECLTPIQRSRIDTVAYHRYRKLQNDDFEGRTVFFRATVRLGEAPESKAIHVIARVAAFAISGWWNMATVRLWHRACGEADLKYMGAEYQTGGSVYVSEPERPWSPPKFLLS